MEENLAAKTSNFDSGMTFFTALAKTQKPVNEVLCIQIIALCAKELY